MRGVIAVLGFFLVIGGSITTIPSIASTDHSALVAAQQQQPAPTGKLDVDINVGHQGRAGGGAWYANPVWIGIGIVALLLIVVLVAMVARGGGTTVIKE